MNGDRHVLHTLFALKNLCDIQLLIRNEMAQLRSRLVQTETQMGKLISAIKLCSLDQYVQLKEYKDRTQDLLASDMLVIIDQHNQSQNQTPKVKSILAFLIAAIVCLSIGFATLF
jgi:hypothetical protein